ncbi:enoyl-CoA hydratase/isomerase (plasmid) [Photobacterium sp. GJ3]|uniref:enoyl-CoA hydratase/isomerase n=1 Tax=Photobacterium sp. GJ3 TaxID=2829502 RepID=UPI001B8CB881|nr:enoyl-CoA hydratase/isomerase [Photobacterium sp. GJ3]QUJ69456.1 enoyl-CoA hydratase/isomerase [Photobacterium sp. GJ3]
MIEAYQTIRVRSEGSVCYLQLYRPDAHNTINHKMIHECYEVLALCRERSITVIVLEGLPEVFCLGGDLDSITGSDEERRLHESMPEQLYDLWTFMATGPFITIAHVCGRVNAGGIGFVACCDIVISDPGAQFSLSELLFGLMPACVFPFLTRRTSFQKAHHLTLMTKPISAELAKQWGLVDECESDSLRMLQQYLSRLKKMNKIAISRYKRYISALNDNIQSAKPLALKANKEVFSDQETIQNIRRYLQTGQFPWE